MKRILDAAVALTGLVVLSPLLAAFCLLVWAQDGHSPLYIATRVGRNGRMFRIIKLRTMVEGADRNGVDSTAADDARITLFGHFIRRHKLDELTQLINVLKGDMSLTGPRPNVQSDVDLYTDVERKLLSMRPGITDLASIVFSHESEILAGSDDPDLDYNRLIRPWKSRLGLLYIENQTLVLDFKIIYLTLLSLISRERALAGINKLLNKMEADIEVKRVVEFPDDLQPYPPPGSNEIAVRARQQLPVDRKRVIGCAPGINSRF